MSKHFVINFIMTFGILYFYLIKNCIKNTSSNFGVEKKFQNNFFTFAILFCYSTTIFVDRCSSVDRHNVILHLSIVFTHLSINFHILANLLIGVLHLSTVLVAESLK